MNQEVQNAADIAIMLRRAIERAPDMKARDSATIDAVTQAAATIYAAELVAQATARSGCCGGANQ
jgi:hypothetical protein